MCVGPVGCVVQGGTCMRVAITYPLSRTDSRRLTTCTDEETKSALKSENDILRYTVKYLLFNYITSILR